MATDVDDDVEHLHRCAPLVAGATGAGDIDADAAVWLVQGVSEFERPLCSNPDGPAGEHWHVHPPRVMVGTADDPRAHLDLTVDQARQLHAALGEALSLQSAP